MSGMVSARTAAGQVSQKVVKDIPRSRGGDDYILAVATPTLYYRVLIELSVAGSLNNAR